MVNEVKEILETPKAPEVPVEKSKREMIEDALINETPEAPAGEAKESPEEPELSDEAKELIESTSDKAKAEPNKDGEEVKTDDLNDFLEEPQEKEEKSNVQKRIDKLTARLHAQEEELASLKTNKAPDENKTIEYTDMQLEVAMKKAFDDGDSKLVLEIINYKTEKAKRDLVNQYTEVEKKNSQVTTVTQQEWNNVVQTYSKYGESNSPEFYPNSRADLNLQSNDTLLYKVAMTLYYNEDPSVSARYKQPGGQALAVADAFNRILSKKATAVVDTQKKLLEKKLMKEKRKKSVAGSGQSVDDSSAPSKPMTESERLADYISERKKYQFERGM